MHRLVNEKPFNLSAGPENFLLQYLEKALGVKCVRVTSLAVTLESIGRTWLVGIYVHFMFSVIY